jgi:phosphate starvation-inducible PhoH-like protein
VNPRDNPGSAEARLLMSFDDNSLLPQLFGDSDQHLVRIERALGIALASRGNRLAISGPAARAELARAALASLYDRLKRGHEVDAQAVDAALRMAPQRGAEAWSDSDEIRTRKRRIGPRGPVQAQYIKALRTHEMVFGLGPAGTGKTYLAVAMAVDMLMNGKVERIVLSRPAVEAGERLGFLRPLYDALHDMLPGDQVTKRIGSGEIEIAPLAFMRGRTLANAYVILDEAQNTTPVQMKMFLTRLGENARMAVTGDLSQIDLPKGARSGLTDAIETLGGVEGIAMVRFSEADVVRHPLVARIVTAYDRRDKQRKPHDPQG